MQCARKNKHRSETEGEEGRERERGRVTEVTVCECAWQMGGENTNILLIYQTNKSKATSTIVGFVVGVVSRCYTVYVHVLGHNAGRETMSNLRLF